MTYGCVVPNVAVGALRGEKISDRPRQALPPFVVAGIIAGRHCREEPLPPELCLPAAAFLAVAKGLNQFLRVLSEDPIANAKIQLPAQPASQPHIPQRNWGQDWRNRAPG